MFQLLDTLAILVPVLLAVAFRTILERKVRAATQRRVGPNAVGFYGILQPFADALKLILKESIRPAPARKSLFIAAPIISLRSARLGWAIIPFGYGLSVTDFHLGVVYSLALSSLGVYGILFAGWAANSKYAFLGSLRSASQRISYELLLSSAVLAVLLCSGSFSYTEVLRVQEAAPLAVPLLPLFVLFFIAALAETNRTPFDLTEAESELVAGYFTEHSSLPFVLFFLAEYASIVLRSASTAIFFCGGPLRPEIFENNTWVNSTALVLALKTAFFTVLFVWVRATLPRLRYDALRTVAWTEFLPRVIAALFIVPIVLGAFDLYL